MPESTLKSWVSGRRYVVASGPRFWPPLIARPDRKDSRLSFSNLIEVHVLSALRKKSEILQAYLERIERDIYGLPIRIYPLTHLDYRNAPKFVMIDPVVAFGRPVIERKAIKTSVIAERFKAGESIDEIAEDYDLEAFEVEEGRPLRSPPARCLIV